MTEAEVAQAIYPAGFYQTKARQLLTIAQLLEPRGDEVPRTKEELLKLPGVGPKTANLVLNLAFGVDEICVDIHVHRIPNRLGWISTETPEASEAALRSLWPRQYWIEANALLVSFGQTVCTPVSPRCSTCPFAPDCSQKGIGRHHR
jgi:endonuclease-3